MQEGAFSQLLRFLAFQHVNKMIKSKFINPTFCFKNTYIYEKFIDEKATYQSKT